MDSSEIARQQLVRFGIPSDKILVAWVDDTPAHRTYATAEAARRALANHHINVGTLNVFTLGAHARRSRLIFSRTFGPNVQVGAIGWQPIGYADGPWWRSSDRAEDMIKETAGYFYELLLNFYR